MSRNFMNHGKILRKKTPRKVGDDRQRIRFQRKSIGLMMDTDSVLAECCCTRETDNEDTSGTQHREPIRQRYHLDLAINIETLGVLSVSNLSHPLKVNNN